MNQITLVSKEGTKFTTSILMADLCTLIQNVLQDYQETEEIPLPHVSSALLELILSYANHHNFKAPDPPRRPISSKLLGECLSDA